MNENYGHARTSGGGSRAPLLSNGVLLLCVLVLAAIVIWQNIVQPQFGPRGEGGAGERPRPQAGRSLPPPPPITPRGDLADDERTTMELFKAASPAVVHITTHTVRRNLFSLNVMEVPRGEGSGFVWDEEGHVVTNYHVIEGASGAQIAMADGSTWPAELIGIAPEKDLAVLRVDAPSEELRALPVGNSHDVGVGQKVFVIGNPFGLDHTLTTGVVSAVGREIESIGGRPITDVIQTDAAINPGNSGGPMLDSSGRLIGMTTAIVSPSGAYAGIGFAIPVDTIYRSVPQLIAHGRLIHPGLAITVAPDAWIRRLGIEGVLILAVEEDSSASRAGLRSTRRDADGDVVLGDIIVAVDEHSVESVNDLLDAFEEHEPGDEVTLTVLHDGEPKKIVAELEPSEYGITTFP